MKYFFIVVLLCVINSTSAQRKDFYTEIDFKKYSSYKLIDTLTKKGSFTVTRRIQMNRSFKSYVECVEIVSKTSKRYFVLNYDAYLKDDSTIVAFAPAFKITNNDGGFMKYGLWFYATFYRERSTGNTISIEEESGTRFAVDSLPPTWDDRELPTEEGIYYYQFNKLVRISPEQSEEQFYSMKKNGFYFLPNSGRFFTKHDIRSIK